MIIRWKGETALEPTAGEYDAIPPLNALHLGAGPRTLSADREAIAAYLAFGAWTSGDLTLPRPLSPATAEAIERDALPIRIRPREVQYAPTALPRGSRSVEVFTDHPPGPTDDVTIVVLPNVGTDGALRSRTSLTISSNAVALDMAARPGEESCRARLAIAVLVAEDMDADQLRLHAPSPLPEVEVNRLRALLSSVNLGLDVEVCPP